MGAALVAGGGHDEVGVEDLVAGQLADEAVLEAVAAMLDAADVDLQALRLLALVDLDDVAAEEHAVGPLALVDAEKALLVVEHLVQVVDELEADDAVVGGLGLLDEGAAVGLRLGVQLVDVAGVEDGVDERRVVGGLEEVAAHDHPRLGVGVRAVDVAEDLGGGLAGADDGDAVGAGVVLEDLGHELGVLGGVDDLGVLGGEDLGDVGLAAVGDEDVAGAVGRDLAGLDVAGLDGPHLDAALGRRVGGDGDDLAAVLDDVVEVGGTPAEVVLVLGAGGEEGVEVGELNEAVVAVEVVEEGELRAGVAEGGHVLDEGDLHLGTGQEHARVPGEGGLLLEEEDLGRGAAGELAAGLLGVVNGDGDGQGGRAEAAADEVVDLAGVGREQVGGLLDALDAVGVAVHAVAVLVDSSVSIGKGIAVAVVLGEAATGVGAVGRRVAVRRHGRGVEFCEEGYVT